MTHKSKTDDEMPSKINNKMTHKMTENGTNEMNHEMIFKNDTTGLYSKPSYSIDIHQNYI